MRWAVYGVLLALTVGLACFLVTDARRAARESEAAAELEARQLAPTVGGGAALEKALAALASQNFAAALRTLQKKYDAAWAPLTNPPVLEMAVVKSQGELQARAEAVRRVITAAKDLHEFARNTPEIYRRELQKHKLSPAARETEWQQFMGNLDAVNPTIIALRQAQVRQAEALLRVVLMLDQSWGRWQYRPATRDLRFTEAKLADAYYLAYQEFREVSEQVQGCQAQLRTRKQ